MSAVRVVIGITQRVVAVAQGNERRDVLDQSWTRFLTECAVDLLPVPNALADPVRFLRRHGATGIVLTGGGNISPAMGRLDGAAANVPGDLADVAPERDAAETALLRASIDLGWPVIGVCRGMQAMNVFHGGTIVRLEGHAGVRHSLTIVGSSRLIECDFDSQVNSFHDFGIPFDGLGQGIEVLAETEGWPEAFIHRDYPHLGIMWHPERENPFSSNDLLLFRRFLRAV